MAIGEQFSGLDMKNLIGAPLSAAADAGVQLAQSTADFINSVGFDKDGKARSAQFKFNQMSKNEDGSLESQEMCVDVPLLAIVPIPNLQVDEVNVLFDMEVKQSEKKESSLDSSGSFSGSARIGFFKVSISGSVSAHSSNTRSSDNSAKYHVDVNATNHGTPEGLARVLDMMAANVAPTIASSTAVDESGKPLVGEKKSKNDTLKRLRLQKSQLETANSSAQQAFDSAVMNFKREGTNKQNSFSVTIQTKINDAKGEEEITKYTNMGNEITQCWNNFQNTAKDNVIAVASSGIDTALTSIFVLKGVDSAENSIEMVKFSTDNTKGLETLDNNYKRAVEAYKKIIEIQKQLDECNIQYNEAIYGVSVSTNTGGTIGGGSESSGS